MDSEPDRTAERTHAFTVGEYDCAIVSDGSFTYPDPQRLFFANADPDELASVLRRYGIDAADWKTYVSPYPCLLIQTAESTVLVDTGGGDVGDHTGKLRVNLEQVGVHPEAVDTVLLTHLHPDHVGGNLDAGGEPAFPNADYLVSATEAAFWLNDPDLSSLRIPDPVKTTMLDFVERQVRPLGDRLHRIDEATQLSPGMRTIPAPGHTPGHVAVEVSSGDETFLYLVDLIFHPVHVERPEWVAVFDLDPETAVASRRRLLQRAADEATLVMAQHVPAPGLGRVETGETGFKWMPVPG